MLKMLVLMTFLMVGAQQAEFLSQYPPGTLANMFVEKPRSKVVPLESLSAEIQRGTFALGAAPGDVEYQGVRIRRIQMQRRVVVSYLGEQRATSPELRKAIDYWGGLATSKQNYSKVFASEFAFSENGKTYWLPVNLLATGQLPMGDTPTPHFKSKEQYVLFVHSVAWMKDGRPVLVVLSGVPKTDLPHD